MNVERSIHWTSWGSSLISPAAHGDEVARTAEEIQHKWEELLTKKDFSAFFQALNSLTTTNHEITLLRTDQLKKLIADKEVPNTARFAIIGALGNDGLQIDTFNEVAATLETEYFPAALDALPVDIGRRLLTQKLATLTTEEIDALFLRLTQEKIMKMIVGTSSTRAVNFFKDCLNWWHQRLTESRFDLDTPPDSWADCHTLILTHLDYLKELDEQILLCKENNDKAGVTRLNAERLRYKHEHLELVGKTKLTASSRKNKIVAMHHAVSVALLDPRNKRSRTVQEMKANPQETFYQRYLEEMQYYVREQRNVPLAAPNILKKKEVQILAKLMKDPWQKKLSKYLQGVRQQVYQIRRELEENRKTEDDVEETAWQVLNKAQKWACKENNSALVVAIVTYLTDNQRYGKHSTVVRVLQNIASENDNLSNLRAMLEKPRLQFSKSPLPDLLTTIVTAVSASSTPDENLLAELEKLASGVTTHGGTPLFIIGGYRGQRSLLQACEIAFKSKALNSEQIRNFLEKVTDEAVSWHENETWVTIQDAAEAPFHPSGLDTIDLPWLQKQIALLDKKISDKERLAKLPYIKTKEIIRGWGAEKSNISVFAEKDLCNTYVKAVARHNKLLQYQQGVSSLAVKLLKAAIRTEKVSTLPIPTEWNPLLEGLKLENTLRRYLKKLTLWSSIPCATVAKEKTTLVLFNELIKAGQQNKSEQAPQTTVSDKFSLMTKLCEAECRRNDIPQRLGAKNWFALTQLCDANSTKTSQILEHMATSEKSPFAIFSEVFGPPEHVAASIAALPDLE